MYFKIILLPFFLLNFIIVKCEKCKDYNYDYYYPIKIYKIEKNNYAIGSYNNKLIPWISISDNTYKYGTKVYIDFFNNLNITIGNNTLTHNGCFRIDDKSEDDCFVRIFTENEINNKDINKKLINVKKQDNCTLLNMDF